MQCPGCSKDNAEQARFCLQCGARLPPICPQCQTALPPGAQFCWACGVKLRTRHPEAQTPAEFLKRLVSLEYAERLLATRGKASSERRMLTMLLCELKGSTSMAEKLNPEDWRAIGMHARACTWI